MLARAKDSEARSRAVALAREALEELNNAKIQHRRADIEVFLKKNRD
jgi:hypothetical protein